MVLSIITSVSFLVSAVIFGGLALLFADSLLLRFTTLALLKALGFTLLAIGSAVNFFDEPYSQLITWLLALGLGLLLVAFVFDPHSKLKLLLPVAVATLLLQDHTLLFALGLLITIAVFQLAYTTRHRDLIPLGVGFLLWSLGEYFFSLAATPTLQAVAEAGSFLSLFASLTLLGWLWSYLAIRIVSLFRADKKFNREV